MYPPSSPLRYPGGKRCLFRLVSDILRLNKLERKHYAEPFAGGCGLALELLFQGNVSEIHINDIDLSIWAFWHCVLEHPKDLVSMIKETPVTIDEWHHQREVHASQNSRNPLALGFSAFFLNRTNRSGIIKNAGVIGGVHQRGNYKMDCRFNRESLQRRVLRISKYRCRIHLSQLDAIQFIGDTSRNFPKKTFYCIDPPYFLKGHGLYTNYYSADDHKKLADFLMTHNQPWITTYDNVDQIIQLYKARRQYELSIKYSIQVKRTGTELLIASKGLKLPAETRASKSNSTKKRGA